MPGDTARSAKLWFAWYSTVTFYCLYGFLFFVVTRTQPPGKPWLNQQEVVQWFAGRHDRLLIGFALVFVTGGLSATAIALISYSIRRMSVSRAFAHSYLLLYAVERGAGLPLHLRGHDNRCHAPSPRPGHPTMAI